MWKKSKKEGIRGQGPLGLEGWRGAVALWQECACSATTASASQKPLCPAHSDLVAKPQICLLGHFWSSLGSVY